MKRLFLAASALLSLGLLAAQAQTSTFTYQGRLTDDVNPASTYEMQFSLFGSLAGPDQIGSTITNSSVAVNNGIFTVQLDFSPTTPFATGADRWLQIAVRKAADPPGFTTLTPRQQITSSPYSIRTLSANAADSLSSVCVGCASDAMISDTLTINGGTINNTVIGGTTAAAGTFTNLTSTGDTTVGNASADTVTINAGPVNLPNATSAPDALVLGGDANLYRSAPDTLKTDDALVVTGTVSIGFGANATHFGETAFSSGPFATAGDAQASVYTLRRVTTGTTSAELFLDGSSERLTIAANRAMSFDILVVAKTADSAGGETAGYTIRGVIENQGGVTQFIGAPPTITVLGEDDAVWSVAVAPDNANDALVVTVAGNTGDTVRWLATVRTAEVTF